jgi:hypothetical protein
MIRAHALEAVEVALDGYHVETTTANMALRAAGFTSLAVSYRHDRRRSQHDAEKNPKPSVEPTRTLVVGVGKLERSVEHAGGEVRGLQAFAAWAETPDEIRELALTVGKQNLAWRCYAAKPSHLPSLTPPAEHDSSGRWFVCYAEQTAPVPEGISLDG